MGACETKPHNNTQEELKTIVLRYRPSNTKKIPKLKNPHKATFLQMLLVKQMARDIRFALPNEKFGLKLLRVAQTMKVHRWRNMNQIELKEDSYKSEYLSFLKNEDLSNIGLKLSAGHLSAVKTFYINLSQFPESNNLTFKAITDTFKKTIHVENFTFMCEDPWGNVTDTGLDMLGNAIGRNLTGLKALTLALKSFNGITDLGFKCLVSGIRLVSQNLKHFALSIERCPNLTDESLYLLGTRLGRTLVHLETLELVFRGCTNITESGMQALASATHKNLTHLKRINLDFVDCPFMTEMGFDMLQLPVAGLENISEQFLDPPFLSLQSMHLKLSDNLKVTDTEVAKLGYFLSYSCPVLKDLKLSLSRCTKITDKGTEMMMEGFGKGLKNLEALEIDLSWCYELTNLSLEALRAEIFQRRFSLQNVIISFFKCGKVKREEIDKLKSEFSMIKQFKV